MCYFQKGCARNRIAELSFPALFPVSYFYSPLLCISYTYPVCEFLSSNIAFANLRGLLDRSNKRREANTYDNAGKGTGHSFVVLCVCVLTSYLVHV